MNFFILKRKIFKKKNIFYCKYFFNLFEKYSYRIISNCVKLFNRISKKLINNEINMDLILNIADKFFFSVFKLIKKVSL